MRMANFLIVFTILWLFLKEGSSLMQCTLTSHHGCLAIGDTLCCNNYDFQKFSAVPANDSLLRLDLSDNQIRRIPNGSFHGWEHLKELDLTGNPLQVIEELAFERLTSLESLKFFNSAFSTDWRPSANSFGKLTSLQLCGSTDILSSDFSSWYPDMVANIVDSMRELSTLHICYYRPFVLPKSFENHHSIKELIVTKSERIPPLEIREDSFALLNNLSSLKLHVLAPVTSVSLDIWKNSSLPFGEILLFMQDDYAIERQNYLKYQRLTHVVQNETKDIETGTKHLTDFTTKDLLTIKKEDRHGYVTEVRFATFGGISVYYQLVKEFYRNFQSIIRYKEVVSFTVDLGKVVISNGSELFQATNPIFNFQKYMKVYDHLCIDEGRLGDVRTISVTSIIERSCMVALHYRISIQRGNPNEHNMTGILFEPRNSSFKAYMQVLSLSGNNLGSLCIGNQDMQSLSYLNLSDCNIDVINPSFLTLPFLEVLDLSRNPLKFCHSHRDVHCISRSTFKDMDALKELYLDEIAMPDIDSKALPALRILSLRGCKLENTFILESQYFPNITTLDLSNNSISTLNLKMLRALPRLTALDMTNNQLLSFNFEIANFINASRSEDINFALGVNPYMCTCSNIGTYKLLLDVSGIHFSQTTCKTTEGSQFELSVPDVRKLEKKCLAKEARLRMIGVVIGSTFVTLVGLITMGQLYRKRWSIMKTILLWKDRRIASARKHLRVEGEEEAEYEFDAFIAHNHEVDYRWVMDCLFAELEENRGLKLCIGERDFKVGWPIMENISHAVEKSRHTVIVLSAAFATSNWCETELQVALSRGFQHIIVILLERQVLGSPNLSRSVRNVLKTVTYSEYPHSGVEAQEFFWTNLHRSISR